jgi:acetyl esterase/lipase
MSDIIEKTLTYGRVDDTELLMDIFLPGLVAAPRPAVLFIHGGGWEGGNRSQFAWHSRALAQQGFVTASASYRLSGVAPYPAALDDCQRAVRWLRKNAGELGLDPARLGAVGSSAGGHLVACLGVRETRNDDVADLRGIASRVTCVVDVHGIHDFPGMEESHRTGEYCTRFLGGTRDAKPEAWADASPLRFVDRESAPMLLIHDPGDDVVPYDQSARLAAALINAARPVEFMPSPGSGHGFIYNPDDPWTQRAWPIAGAWLKRCLQKRQDA